MQLLTWTMPRKLSLGGGCQTRNVWLTLTNIKEYKGITYNAFKTVRKSREGLPWCLITKRPQYYRKICRELKELRNNTKFKVENYQPTLALHSLIEKIPAMPPRWGFSGFTPQFNRECYDSQNIPERIFGEILFYPGFARSNGKQAFSAKVLEIWLLSSSSPKLL